MASSNGDGVNGINSDDRSTKFQELLNLLKSSGNRRNVSYWRD